MPVDGVFHGQQAMASLKLSREHLAQLGDGESLPWLLGYGLIEAASGSPAR